jgi:molybdenum cofactor cytidylyltransferase
MRRVTALVLAAGASSRMGRPKQLLPLEGSPLVRRAAQAALEAGCEDVVVVVGAYAEEVAAAVTDLRVRVARNSAWREGLGASLRCGARAAHEAPDGPADAILVVLADQPRVDAALLSRLVAAFRCEGRELVACAYAGRLGPPALFAGRHRAALATLGGDRGAQVLLEGCASDVHRIPFEDGALDVDTPEDYARLAGAPGEAAAGGSGTLAGDTDGKR